MIVGFWAVLKAGGVYVPFDPGYPKERLDLCSADAKVVATLVTQHKFIAGLPAHSATVVCLDTDWNKIIAGQSEENPEMATLTGESRLRHLYFRLYGNT